MPKGISNLVWVHPKDDSCFETIDRWYNSGEDYTGGDVLSLYNLPEGANAYNVEGYFPIPSALGGGFFGFPLGRKAAEEVYRSRQVQANSIRLEHAERMMIPFEEKEEGRINLISKSDFREKSKLEYQLFFCEKLDDEELLNRYQYDFMFRWRYTQMMVEVRDQILAENRDLGRKPQAIMFESKIII